MNAPPKSPYISPTIDITAIILTVAVYWLISLINTPFFKVVHQLLNYRGPIQHIITFIVIRNVVAVLIAKTRKELPAYFPRQLFVFSLIPLLLGFIGAVQGLASAFGGITPYLISDKEIVIKDILGNIAIGTAVSFDTLFLGLMGTVLCIVLYAMSLSLTHKCVQQAGAGYPPQGVGFPDP